MRGDRACVGVPGEILWPDAEVGEHVANVVQGRAHLVLVDERLDFEESPIDLRHANERGEHLPAARFELVVSAALLERDHLHVAEATKDGVRCVGILDAGLILRL